MTVCLVAEANPVVRFVLEGRKLTDLNQPLTSQGEPAGIHVLDGLVELVPYFLVLVAGPSDPKNKREGCQQQGQPEPLAPPSRVP